MPLAVAVLNVSNPQMGPMDMLSRLSHDSDEAVAQNAILALGEASLLVLGSRRTRMTRMRFGLISCQVLLQRETWSYGVSFSAP